VEILSAIVPRPAELCVGATPPSEGELDSWSLLVRGQDRLRRQGAHPGGGQTGEEFYVRTLAQPAVDIHGINVGEAEFLKTIIPARATASVSVRVASGQDVNEIERIVRSRLNSSVQPGALLRLETKESWAAAAVDVTAPIIRAVGTAFDRMVGRTPVFRKIGGTLPVLSALTERGVPTVLTGFGVPESNIHAPNERLPLRHVALGVQTARQALLFAGSVRA
jgi:acetylornithine deacetylase/succinyl-diaminopimelate desuccinylase-like protein